MTQEELFDLAEKAGLGFVRHASEKDIEKFEQLVKQIAEHEREKFCAVLRQLHDSYSLASDSNAIRARGQA
jgi:uncharacterized protein YecA (UPF0149 family)